VPAGLLHRGWAKEERRVDAKYQAAKTPTTLSPPGSVGGKWVNPDTTLAALEATNPTAAASNSNRTAWPTDSARACDSDDGGGDNGDAPVSASTRVGLMATTLAETTKSSQLLPGSQSLMYSALSGLGTTDTFTNPQPSSKACSSDGAGAPATQHAKAVAVAKWAGNGWSCVASVFTTSETQKRPPGFNTRKHSRSTWALSGLRLMTQLEMTT